MTKDLLLFGSEWMPRTHFLRSLIDELNRYLLVSLGLGKELANHVYIAGFIPSSYLQRKFNL
jgi:HEPN domain-containing protein